MGRLTAITFATSAALLLLAGLLRLAPRLTPGLAPVVPGAASSTAPHTSPPFTTQAGGAPFATTASPSWSTADAAVAGLQERLKRQPDDAPAYAQLASLYLQKARETGDPTYYTRAEGALKQATARTPDDPLAIVLTGSLQLARHDFAEALASGERAKAVAPRSAIVYGIIGDAAVELGQYDASIAALQTMVDLRPDLASYSRIAYARELHGDTPGAIEAMQRAVNAGAPDSEGTNWSRIQLGHLYFLSGDLDAAERAYSLALQLLPNYVHAIAGQGRVAAARGDLKGAIELYRKAQEITPLPEYVIALGDLYRATGDLAGAARQDDLVRVIAQLQQASGMDVDLEMALFEADRATTPPAFEGALQKARATYGRRQSVLAADVLAWTLYRAGRPAEALPYAREALRLGSKDPQLLFHAGAVELAAGDPLAARADLEAAAALNPAFSVRYAPEAQRLLEQAQEATR